MAAASPVCDTEVLGMRIVMKFDDRKMAFMSFGNNLGDIRLFEVGATAEPDRQTLGFNHLAVEPEGGLAALEQLHQRLIDKGVKIDKLKSYAGDRHKSIYFCDQDGNRLEFYWKARIGRASAAKWCGKPSAPLMSFQNDCSRESMVFMSLPRPIRVAVTIEPAR